MENIETYEEREFPEFRNSTLNTLDLGIKKHPIPFLVEVDVASYYATVNHFPLSLVHTP